MKLSRLFPLLALLLAASLHAENTHKEVRIASPWPAQNTIIAILSSPQWASVDAVIHHRVYVNPKGMFWWCRETSEEALQFLWLAKTLYPARFADVDIRKETREFYRQFFGLTLSDAQMSDVLNPPR
ncbi:hypothetical protein OGT28_002076 [Escherichia coli]|nr:hypothetical protein [Escherichia coli]EKW4776171.1 hypothetical protein [Escherichia coli]